MIIVAVIILVVCVFAYVLIARERSRSEALDAEIVRLTADYEAKLDDLKAKIVTRDRQIAELGEKVQTLANRISDKPPTTSAEQTSSSGTPAPKSGSRITAPAASGPQYFDIVDVDDHLNIRRSAGISETKIGQIPRSATCIQNLNETKTISNQTWIKINFKGTVGWVHAAFLKPATGCP